MSKPYILLSGAIKNVGDFLIFDRAKKLIHKYVSENTIELNRWENHDDKLDLLNSSRGIIICGGPGFTKNMHPNTYPLISDLSLLKVPIFPLGVGWSGIPENEPESFKFEESGKQLMDYIHQNSQMYSCRDNITFDIIKNLGYSNIQMTGCPVWYDIESLNKKLQFNADFKRIVFTTPAKVKLTKQTIQIIDLLKKNFPKSEIIVSFHRGINYDKYTSPRQVVAYNIMSAYAKLRGCKVVDVSFDVKKIDFYADCDLHLGYRVHAHLFFLSKRLPSILISEDGRGLGMNKTLNLPNLIADESDLLQKIQQELSDLKNKKTEKFESAINFIDSNFSVMLKYYFLKNR